MLADAISWWLGVGLCLAFSAYMILTDLPLPREMDTDDRARLIRSLAIRFACVMTLYTLGLISCYKSRY